MEEEPRDQSDESPPFLGSWKKIYALVVFELLILVALFYVFTEVFS